MEAGRPIVVVVGTRPEGIKMAPVYHALKKEGLPVVLCSTTQHDTLLKEVFTVFGITPDFELGVMRPNQTLAYLTQAVLTKIDDLFAQINPALVLVQGDTTTVMAAALAALYRRIPVGHVEAGLRTETVDNPFPEEFNRRMARLCARYHFAPTLLAAANLLREGVSHDALFVTGNTVVDALYMVQRKIQRKEIQVQPLVREMVEKARKQGKKTILLTTHRRESFGEPLERILSTLKQFLYDYSGDVVCLYPCHPNPHVVQAVATSGIGDLPSVSLLKPLPYSDLVFLLDAVDGVVTDSGGIQEEAVSLGKQVIVLRETTERIEGVWAGLAHLVGSNPTLLLRALHTIIAQERNQQVERQFLYGTGDAACTIVRIIKERVLNVSVPTSSANQQRNNLMSGR